MNRGILALGAAILLAAVIGLYIALRTGDQPDGASPAAADHKPIADAAPGKPRKIRDAPVAPIAPTTNPATTEHTIGETRIRDHRTGEHAQPEIPPPSHPPGGREIAPQITGDLGQQLRPLVRTCAAHLAPEARSDKSRIDGQITIAIRDHQATVVAAAFQLRDVAEAAQAEVKQCLTQRAVGLTAPASNEADLDGYAISLSLALP
ncbi:MAG: hypothetical protein E6J90_15060 [Deltaproteobacteria bacterium]|nr:MAG: hypothetical protein E6J91_20925 [Deltaproteobacteria bacterium]TMQ20973.1 MAG: hypothetical protein E6J90_15060 [Deltaproteobacteria bacterium]